MAKFWQILALLLVATLTQAQMYRWVDEDGKVHYGDQPPPKASAESIRPSVQPGPTKPPPPSPSPGASGAPAEPPKIDVVFPTVAPGSLATPERCKAAKQRLAVYQQSQKIERANEFGERRFLSDEERNKLISGSKSEVERNCRGLP